MSYVEICGRATLPDLHMNFPWLKPPHCDCIFFLSYSQERVITMP